MGDVVSAECGCGADEDNVGEESEIEDLGMVVVLVLVVACSGVLSSSVTGGTSMGSGEMTTVGGVISFDSAVLRG